MKEHSIVLLWKEETQNNSLQHSWVNTQHTESARRGWQSGSSGRTIKTGIHKDGHRWVELLEDTGEDVTYEHKNGIRIRVKFISGRIRRTENLDRKFSTQTIKEIS
jgi:hypothetical protein